MLAAVPYRPGLVKDDTDLGAWPYATEAERIVWRNGRAEVMPGWTTALGASAGISGTIRGLHEWASNTGLPRLAIGTDNGLYVWTYGSTAPIDITPIRSSGTLGSDPIATTNGSDIVTVTLAAHALRVGDTLTLRGSTSVGGVQLSGGSGTLVGPLQANDDSDLVTVTHTSHGLLADDVVFLTVGSTFAGIGTADFLGPDGAGLRPILLDDDRYQVQVATAATTTASGGGSVDYVYARRYAVVGVSSASSFTLQARSTASSTATGGGASVLYQLGINGAITLTSPSLYGYGTGLYGVGAYGVPSAGGAVVEVAVNARLWSLDSWGEQLVAALIGGAVYWWDGNLSSRAKVLSNAPARVTGIIVTAERFLMALGCTDVDGTFDPLLIRHSDLEDLNVWTPSATNSAGDLRLGAGSRIVGRTRGRAGMLVWTDTSLYGLRYVGSFDQIYRADELGVGCGLLAPNAMAGADGDAYWLTPSLQPYVYRGGRPTPLPCPLRQWFSRRINLTAAGNTFMAFDHRNPALMLFYPSSTSEPESYLRLDLPEAERDPMAGWSAGALTRTAWSPGLVWPEKLPLVAALGGIIYRHDDGYNADGSPIDWRLKWSPLEKDDGHGLVLISRAVIDANRSEAFTLRYHATIWPTKPTRVREVPYGMTCPHCDLRIQGRQIVLELEGSTSDRFEFGPIKLDMTGTGLR
jgi:hypothetical protein